MKVWQFFLTIAGIVGVTYVAPFLLAMGLYTYGVGYPWNLAIMFLGMTAFVLLLLVLCQREERRNREKAS